MRIYAFFLLFCIQIHIIEALHIEQNLYDGLSYSNGVCFKKVEVSYLTLGRDPLNESDDSIAITIKNATQNTPYTSMSFLYRGQKYYISIHEKCKTPNMSEGEKIILHIQFYKDIKQPYKYKHPYAIITKIENCSYSKKNTSHCSSRSKNR